MSYINNEERIKKKQQFFVLYGLTIIVLMGIGYALYASAPQPNQIAPVQAYVAPEQPIITETKPDTLLRALQLRLAALEKDVDEKNKKIDQLQKQPKAPITIVRTTTPAPTNDKALMEEIKFLKWALSSQSGDVAQLKRENARLKAQVNDLKKDNLR